MGDPVPSKDLSAVLTELDKACYSARAERYGSVRIGLSDALLILAALRTAPEPAAALQSVQTMFRAAVSSLAEISQALDIPDHVASVANGNAEILKAIAHLKRAAQPPRDGQ